MPAERIPVIMASTGSDHTVPAAEPSRMAIPMDEPVPDQVQVKLNERATRLKVENDDTRELQDPSHPGIRLTSWLYLLFGRTLVELRSKSYVDRHCRPGYK